MHVRTHYVALCLSLSLTATPVLAADFRAYPFLHYFDYTEYDDNGDFLDGETGWLPGFGMAYAETLEAHSFGVRFELAGGTVDYDGETQTGIPHETETETILYRFGLDYAYTLPAERFQLVMGADYVGWDRDIQPNYNPLVGGVVGGLLEEYRWWELHAGIDALLYARNRHSGSVRLEALYIADPQMTVVNLGNTELYMGEEPGYRVTGRYLYRAPEAWSVGVEAYWEEWEFGRSDAVNSPIGPILEPRSETQHRGIRLIVEQRF
jgi:hypothetical protein